MSHRYDIRRSCARVNKPFGRSGHSLVLDALMKLELGEEQNCVYTFLALKLSRDAAASCKIIAKVRELRSNWSTVLMKFETYCTLRSLLSLY